MLGLLSKLKSTAHLTSRIMRLQAVRNGISAWRFHARQAALPSLLYTMARSAFEAADHETRGTLSPLEAHGAFQALLDTVDSSGLACGERCGPLPSAPSESSPVDFNSFIKQLHELPLPEGLQPALAVASTGLRCVCGSFMTERRCAELYGGGPVRCDFAGQLVRADSVWHCERHRASAVHPFGFDVAAESVAQFRSFQQTARLHVRLSEAIAKQDRPAPELSEAVDSEVHELTTKLAAAIGHKQAQSLEARRAVCVEALLPHTKASYLEIKNDIMQAQAGGLNTKELELRLSFFKSVLETEDWEARKQEAQQGMHDKLDDLQAFSRSLAHDKLRFRDPADRAYQIEQFEKEFAPAQRHAEFEESLAQFQQVSALARDFVGCEKFDENDPDTQQLISSMGQQLLQTLMQQRGMLFMPIHSAYEQVEAGVVFRWQVAVAPLGQHLTLEHTVPLDLSNIQTAQLNQKFVVMHHETQERIRALAECATEGDLNSELTESVLLPSDDAVGEICVICQEEMQSGEQALCINACNHCFHTDCVKGWLLGCKHECPICKAPVGVEQEQGNSFQEGARVVIQGLQSRPDLNGTRGQIAGFIPATGRYRVETSDKGCLSVQSKNLVAMEDQQEATQQRSVEIVQDSDEYEYDEEAELRAALALSLELDEELVQSND